MSATIAAEHPLAGVAVLAAGAGWVGIMARFMWWPTVRETLAERRAAGPQVAAKPRRVRPSVVAAVLLAVALFGGTLAAQTVTAHAADAELHPTAPRGVHVEEYETQPHGGLAVIFTNGARQTLAPCRTEDSAGCWWDSGDRGNHRGHSFVAVRRAGRVCLAFLADRYAAKHDRCLSVDVRTAAAR